MEGILFDECRRIRLPVKHSGIENKMRGVWGVEPRADVIGTPSFLLADGFAIGRAAGLTS